MTRFQLLPRAIQAGAQGCVDKGRPVADLLPSIERIAGGSEAQGAGWHDGLIFRNGLFLGRMRQ